MHTIHKLKAKVKGYEWPVFFLAIAIIMLLVALFTPHKLCYLLGAISLLISGADAFMIQNRRKNPFNPPVLSENEQFSGKKKMGR